MRTYGFYKTLLLPLLLLLHVGGTGGQPDTTSPQTTSHHQAPKEALTEDVLEMVLVIERSTLERTIRETYLAEEEPCGQDISTRLRVKETRVVQKSDWRRLILATALGTCVGILVGGLLVSAVAYCCFRFRRLGGSLNFDQKNSTYRSADVIDCGV